MTNRNHVALLAIALVACAPSPYVARTQPSAPAASPSADGLAATEERLEAEQKAEHARLTKEYEDGIAAQSAELAEAQAAGHAKLLAEKKAREDADRTRCKASRADRLRAANEVIVSWAALWLRAVATNRSWIDGHCKLVDTQGVNYTAKREGGGVTIRSRVTGRVDAVSCSSPRPAGLSEDDVRNYLNGHLTTSLDRVDSDEMPTCREQDREVGLDMSVQLQDVSGLQKVRTWKEP